MFPTKGVIFSPSTSLTILLTLILKGGCSDGYPQALVTHFCFSNYFLFHEPCFCATQCLYPAIHQVIAQTVSASSKTLKKMVFFFSPFDVQALFFLRLIEIQFITYDYPLKVYNSFFSIFTELYNHYHILILEHFCHTKKKPFISGHSLVLILLYIHQLFAFLDYE